MKVGVLGGTGAMGRGLASHLVKYNEVIIGSRDPEKAIRIAGEVEGARAGNYEEVARWSEVAIAAVPYSALGSLAVLADPLAGKLVISIVNPLRSQGGVLHYAAKKTSAAEELAEILGRSRVATAFNSVPVAFFSKPPKSDIDVLVATDSMKSFEEASLVVSAFPAMHAVYVGPLSQAASVERVTVLVLNAARLKSGPRLSVKFVS